MTTFNTQYEIFLWNVNYDTYRTWSLNTPTMVKPRKNKYLFYDLCICKSIFSKYLKQKHIFDNFPTYINTGCNQKVNFQLKKTKLTLQTKQSKPGLIPLESFSL